MSTKTVKPDVQRELARIHAQGRGRLEIDTGAGRLSADILAADAIGCTFETFSYATDKLAGLSMDKLKKLSDALTARLTYLLEPISTVETDAETATVQLRSNPPQKDEDGSSYYELLVRRGGELTLCRYQKAPGQPRQIVPAHLTRQVFERLADDFVAVVG